MNKKGEKMRFVFVILGTGIVFGILWFIFSLVCGVR